ncbi:MAG: RluA family pseudouridine synthase [Clostridia bacterium]|nr:RluA family pseudouridine synthase [Clostridia bacterium]
MKNLKVTEKYNNKKLIKFLLDNIDGLSTSTIYKTLRKKDVKINDKRTSENCLLRTGDDIKIYLPDNLQKKDLNIPIIFEDDNIVIFNKPIGVEVTGENSLSSYAKKLFSNNINKFIEPCHRLDRNTSGLVLFARNQTSLNILLDAFKNHLIEKHYICVVYGIPRKKSERLESYLFKDSKKSMVYISDNLKPGYQKIITSYRILKINQTKNISLLDITLETGKTHQIRAHLAHIGCPIIGDGKYGINKINKIFKLKTQALSSYSLTFKITSDNQLSYLNGITIKQNQVPFMNLL